MASDSDQNILGIATLHRTRMLPPGSFGCAVSQGVEGMIAWRAVQAIGACASVTLARAMVRELYVGRRAAQMMSTR